MGEASLALKFSSNMSESLTSIRSVMTPFRDDLTELEKELTTLKNTKVDLKVDLDRAKRELVDAKKAFKDLGDEAGDDSALKKAQANYEQIAEQLRVVSKAANQTEKDMLSAAEVGSKLDNRAASRSASAGSESGMLSQLGQAGLYGMAGDVLSTIANAAVGSTFGDEMGTVFSSVLSSAGAGAALGSMIGTPGIGTAVGAAIGGAVGLVGGVAQNFQKEDDAFKGYYKDLYGNVTDDRSAMTVSGSAIAAQREMDRGAFSKLLGGEDVADEYLAQVQDMANRTPFLYGDLVSMSKSLAPAFGDDPEEMLRILAGVGDAGAASGLGTGDMSMVATAMGRMQSTGKTSLEYLNILQERGIDAYGMVADARGVSVNEMLGQISKGKIPGAEAVEAILKGMEDKNGPYFGAMQLLSETFTGLSSTVEGLRQELDNAKGEGYNAKRKEDLEEESAWLSGPESEALKEAYRQIGEWEASVENEKGRLQRDIVGAVMTGVVPQDLDEKVKGQLADIIEEYRASGDESGAALARAQALALDAYYASEGYQQLQASNKNLAADIRDDAYVIGSWRDAGYNMGLEFTKGMGAALQDTARDTVLATPATEEAARRSRESFPGADGSHAAGLKRVPFDGYLAVLHQGEEVKTAAEARSGGQGGSPQIVITGNTFEVRSDGDVAAIAATLADEIELRVLAGRM